MNLIHFSSLIHKMSVFSLTISSLTMSSLPWFMDLKFQVPMKYHSLQRWTLLSPPDTSTTERHSCFCPTTSFSLELLVIALCSSPVAYWIPSDLGWGRGLIFQRHIFLSFHTVHWVLAARILGWVAVSSPSVPCFTTLHYVPSVLGGPAQHGLSLHWVTQAPAPWQDCDPWRGLFIIAYIIMLIMHYYI